MAFVTRWPVLVRHDVTDADLDPDGLVRNEVLAGWVAGACAEYLDRCATLPAGGLQPRTDGLPSGARLGRPEFVVVTAGATEVKPDSFTLAVRVRAGEVALNARCLVEVAVTDAIRDELIAIEHAARHIN